MPPNHFNCTIVTFHTESVHHYFNGVLKGTVKTGLNKERKSKRTSVQLWFNHSWKSSM